MTLREGKRENLQTKHHDILILGRRKTKTQFVCDFVLQIFCIIHVISGNHMNVKLIVSIDDMEWRGIIVALRSRSVLR